MLRWKKKRSKIIKTFKNFRLSSKRFWTKNYLYIYNSLYIHKFSLKYLQNPNAITLNEKFLPRLLKNFLSRTKIFNSIDKIWSWLVSHFTYLPFHLPPPPPLAAKKNPLLHNSKSQPRSLKPVSVPEITSSDV